MTLWVIQGDIYLDNKALSVLQTPIGTFSSKEDAELFMFKMRPVWGNWEAVELHSPRSVADRAVRSGAANFLDAQNVPPEYSGRPPYSEATLGESDAH